MRTGWPASARGDSCPPGAGRGSCQELVAQRAAERIGERVEVLIEEVDGEIIGRAAHQGPEVDGNVSLITSDQAARGDFVNALVRDSRGIDLVATTVADQQMSRRGRRPNPGHHD